MDEYAIRLQLHLQRCGETLLAAERLIRESEEWLYAFHERQRSSPRVRRDDSWSRVGNSN